MVSFVLCSVVGFNAKYNHGVSGRIIDKVGEIEIDIQQGRDSSCVLSGKPAATNLPSCRNSTTCLESHRVCTSSGQFTNCRAVCDRVAPSLVCPCKARVKVMPSTGAYAWQDVGAEMEVPDILDAADIAPACDNQTSADWPNIRILGPDAEWSCRADTRILRRMPDGLIDNIVNTHGDFKEVFGVHEDDDRTYFVCSALQP